MTDIVHSSKNTKITYRKRGNLLLGIICMIRRGHEITLEDAKTLFRCKNHNDTFEATCLYCGDHVVGHYVDREEESLV